jgi:hypothetical protein
VDDGHFAPDELVEQRRLARVRRALHREWPIRTVAVLSHGLQRCRTVATFM